MSSRFCAAIALLVMSMALVSHQSKLSNINKEDDIFLEILKELKSINNKGTRQKAGSSVSGNNHINDDDPYHVNDENLFKLQQTTENNKVEVEETKFNPYNDLQNNLMMASHRVPSDKFYGEDPNVDPCSMYRPRIIKETSGLLSSPGFESSVYGNNRTCSWRFEAPPGDVVELKIQSMDIEYHQECSYDSIEIFDVVGRRGISIGKYCGTELPMELLMSSQELLYLYFISDDSNDNGKFEITWRMVPPKLDEPSTPSCGRPLVNPNVDERIVNGQVARPFSWPWLVSIRVYQGGNWSHNCGGAILREDVVITAAHCFYDPKKRAERPMNKMIIVAGEFDEKTTSDGETQTMGIKSWKYHNKYNQRVASSPNDIGIIILDGKLKYNKHVLPVCLPRDPPRLIDLCYLAGWGDTEHTGDRTVLNQVRLPIINHNTCKRSDYYGVLMANTMLCAGYEEGGRDGCQRDSGSPLVCYNEANDRWYMQGIGSWAIGCALPMRPGVYTRVISYTDWIKDACGVRP